MLCSHLPWSCFLQPAHLLDHLLVHAESKQAEAMRTHSLPAQQVHRSWGYLRALCRRADAWLKHTLSANLDALVALALIVVLLLGSLVLAGFLTVRIGQPGFYPNDRPGFLHSCLCNVTNCNVRMSIDIYVYIYICVCVLLCWPRGLITLLLHKSALTCYSHHHQTSCADHRCSSCCTLKQSMQY